MRLYKSLQVLGDVFSQQQLLEDCNIVNVRHSLRSFKIGERMGFYCGLGVGFGGGFALTMLIVSQYIGI